jgi:Protein of unknown function (DUF2637)
MTTTPPPVAVNGALVEQIRQLIDHAHQAGQPTPGRPTLMQRTGARDYQVKKALAILRSPTTSDTRNEHGPATAGDWTDRPLTAGDVVASEFASVGETGDEDGPVTGQNTSTDHQASTTVATPVPRSTRLVAWGGFLLGLTASVLANVLDTWLPATHQPPGWEPGLAPQIGAAVWPAALMFALEALSRVPWPRGFWWLVARYGGVGIVALGSAAISYSHVHDVLMSWGYGAGSAATGPLVIDGLMIISGFALLAISHTNTTSPGHRQQ